MVQRSGGPPMFSLVQGGRGVVGTAPVLASGLWVVSGLSAVAVGGDPGGDGVHGTPLAASGIPAARSGVGFGDPSLWGAYGVNHAPLHAWINEQRVACRTSGHGGLGLGALGWGGPGLYPGFYGFGLSFHRGYGYGGYGLGVGARGGGPPYRGARGPPRRPVPPPRPPAPPPH